MSSTPPPDPGLDFTALYERLRRCAANKLRLEGQRRSLRATELVHEAFLKLAITPPKRAVRKPLALAQRAMQQVLVDRARRRDAKKRGEGRRPLPLDGLAEPLAARDGRPLDWMELQSALQEFGEEQRSISEVLELGLVSCASLEEIAAELGRPLPEVTADWHLGLCALRQRHETDQ